MTSTTVLAFAVDATLALILLAMVFAFLRLMRGPSSPDRVVALDLMTTLVVTFVAVLSIQSGTPELMDVIVAVALIAFLATLAYARYSAQRDGPPPASDDGGADAREDRP